MFQEYNTMTNENLKKTNKNSMTNGSWQQHPDVETTTTTTTTRGVQPNQNLTILTLF